MEDGASAPSPISRSSLQSHYQNGLDAHEESASKSRAMHEYRGLREEATHGKASIYFDDLLAGAAILRRRVYLASASRYPNWISGVKTTCQNSLAKIESKMKKRINVITAGAYSSILIRSLVIARLAARKSGADSVVQEGISYALELVRQERTQRKTDRRARKEQAKVADVQPAPVPA